MQQYLVLGFDSKEEGALEHRMKIRPQHLEIVQSLKASGNFVIGGAQLSEELQMNGSALIVQFETKEELDSYLKREPYILHKVWEKYRVVPFKVANV
ncbi:MAG: YciI family protein [Leadbetterella sp.]